MLGDLKEKEQINQKDLNSNILEHVVLRVDFLRIIDIKDFVKSIQNYLSDLKFVLEEGIFTEVELSINDSEPLITNDIFYSKKNDNRNVYKFSKENELITLTLNKNFIIFEINEFKNYNSEEYIKIFSDIVEKLIKYYADININIVRLGFRKINGFVCKNRTNLYKCVEKKYYNNFPITIINKKNNTNNIKEVKSETVDNFIMDDISFNLFRAIITGEYLLTMKRTEKKISAYKVILDIEGYIRDEQLNMIRATDNNIKNTIDKINEIIFFIFKEVLNHKFLNGLMVEDTNMVLEGVNLNYEGDNKK